MYTLPQILGGFGVAIVEYVVDSQIHVHCFSFLQRDKGSDPSALTLLPSIRDFNNSTVQGLRLVISYEPSKTSSSRVY